LKADSAFHLRPLKIFMQRTASHQIRTTPLAGHNAAREKLAFLGPEKMITSSVRCYFL